MLNASRWKYCVYPHCKGLSKGAGYLFNEKMVEQELIFRNVRDQKVNSTWSQILDVKSSALMFVDVKAQLTVRSNPLLGHVLRVLASAAAPSRQPTLTRSRNAMPKQATLTQRAGHQNISGFAPQALQNWTS